MHLRLRTMIIALSSLMMLVGLGLIGPPSAAAAGPEGVPAVAPGASPAGYLPLDQYGGTVRPIRDERFIDVEIPAFVYANRTYTKVSVSDNGYLVVGGTTDNADQKCCDFPPGADPAPPNNVIAPFWTDLDGTNAPGIITGVISQGARSWFVIEWRVVVFGSNRLQVFEVWLGLNGVEDISLVYDPTQLPDRPGPFDYRVGAENSVGAGDVRSFVPTQDLRVTSTVPTYAQRVEVVSGNGQSAESNQTYAQPLVAKVVGSNGQPYANAPVTFTVTSGSASFAGMSSATVTTGANGEVTAPILTAGSTAGPVTVSATTTYADPATFTATVTRTADAITATSGGGQSAAANSAFAQPLVATVAARDGQPLAGAPVTFTVASGSASFGGTSTATVTTDGSGRATSPTLTAGSTTGQVSVTASTPGVTQKASYALTVTAASANLSASLTVPGSATTGKSFPVKLTVSSAGPSSAINVGSAIAVPSGLQITDGGSDGTVSGDKRKVGFARSALAAGASVEYTVTVKASSTGEKTITAATLSGQTRDPVAANNAAQAKIKIKTNP